MKAYSLRIILFLWSLGSYGQEYFEVQSVHATTTNLKVEDGLPHHCISNTIVDPMGGLWMKLCQNTSVSDNFRLFFFNGIDDQFVHLNISKKNKQSKLYLKGITDDGQLFGYVKHQRSSELFIIDAYNKEVNIFEFNDSLSIKGAIQDVVTDGDQIFVCATTHDRLTIYTINGATLDTVLNTQREVFNDKLECLPLAVDKQAIWFIEPSHNLMRYDRTKQELSRHDISELMIGQCSGVRLYPKSNGVIVLKKVVAQDKVYEVQIGDSLQIKELQLLQEDVDDCELSIYADRSGNLLYLKHQSFWKEGYKGLLSATLQSGDVFTDYTQVLKLASNGFDISGENFKKELYVAYTGGIRIHKRIARSFIISGLHNQSIRGIGQLSATEFLVKGGPLQLIELQPDGDLKPIIPKLSFNCNYRDNFIQGPSGEVYIHHGSQLYSYSKAKVEADLIDMGQEVLRISAFHGDSCLIVDGQRRLMLYDIKFHELHSLDNPLPADIGELYDLKWDGKQTAWLICSSGLYKLNFASSIKLEKKMDNQSFISAVVDEKGQLWLGSLNGIFVFDPVTEHISHITKKTDLPHNTIAGLLIDEFGFIWAATFKGLAIISPEGEVLTVLYESNGLSNNEFNRYSSFKASNGDLFFGTVKGLNVISPKLWWQNYLEKDTLETSLAELSYYDSGAGERIVLSFDKLGIKPLNLPAGAKEIYLKCHISNTAGDRFSDFYYKVKGVNKEWVAASVDNTIRLGSWPPGIQEVIIRGKNTLDERFSSSLSVSIAIQPFFYQRAEFILSLVFIVLLSLGFYIRYHYKRGVEQQVKLRTTNLEEHKAAITEEVHRMKQQLDSDEEDITAVALLSGKSVIKPGPFIDRLNQLVDQHMDNGSFGLDELCHEIGLSKAQVHRRIKSATGKSPAVYMRSVRLHKAMGMLISTDLSISEVAYSVGFNSLSYFSKTFVSEFNKTPSEVQHGANK